MTRKDYIAAAEKVSQEKPAIRKKLFEFLADLFAGDNPRFDRERFREACNV